MLSFFAFSCLYMVAYGQLITPGDQTQSDTFQLYRIIDERINIIQQMAQEISTAVDALSTMPEMDLTKETSITSVLAENSGQRGDLEPANMAGPLLAVPTMPVNKTSSDIVMRPKRSYGRRNYGGYGGYRGGYGNRGYGSGYGGYGNRYGTGFGGYRNMGYNRGYGYGGYNYYG